MMSDLLIAGNCIGYLSALVFELVVIFEVLSKESNWKLRFLVKDLGESFSKYVRYLWLALQVLDLLFHLSYIISFNCRL